MTNLLDSVWPSQISSEASGLSLKSTPKPHPLSIRCIDSVEGLEAIKPQWDELARNAVWRNPTYEHNFLIPAIKHLGHGEVRVVVVEGSTATGESTLHGLFPIVSKKMYHLPIPCVELWRHDQSFDSTPLIAKPHAAQTLGCILDYLSEQKIGLLSLNTISAEPEFQLVLNQVISERRCPICQRDRFERAALRPVDNSDDYVQQFVSKNVKKKYLQRQRRLAELGEVTYELSDDFSDYELLTSQFLEIEASGWKGESGTALACDDSTKGFYEELVFRSAREGKARFVSLKLDGKPIVMLSDLRSGQAVYAYKTAFDEHFSAFSPGLLIEIKNIQYLHDAEVSVSDSCTEPDNPTINRIWGQKLQFQSIVIGLRPGIAQLATRMMPWIRTAANKVFDRLP